MKLHVLNDELMPKKHLVLLEYCINMMSMEFRLQTLKGSLSMLIRCLWKEVAVAVDVNVVSIQNFIMLEELSTVVIIAAN